MKEEILIEIVFARSEKLSELAFLAKGERETYFRGAVLNGVDLRGDDLRGFNFDTADFRNAIVDDNTKIDDTYKKQIEAEKIGVSVSLPPSSITKFQIKGHSTSGAILRISSFIQNFILGLVYLLYEPSDTESELTDTRINISKLRPYDRIFFSDQDLMKSPVIGRQKVKIVYVSELLRKHGYLRRNSDSKRSIYSIKIGNRTVEEGLLGIVSNFYKENWAKSGSVFRESSRFYARRQSVENKSFSVIIPMHPTFKEILVRESIYMGVAVEDLVNGLLGARAAV